jgi:hypothetical protein
VSRDPALSRGGLLAWAFDYSSCITIPAKRRGPHYVPTSLPQEIVLPSMRERVLETPLPVSEAESCALSLENASPTDLNDDSVMTLEHFGENTAKPSDPLSQPRSEAQASARRHESADTVETPNLENAQSTAPQQHDSRCAYSAEPEPPISQLGPIGTKNNDDQNPQCRPPPTPVEPESEARQELCSQKLTANSPSMAAALLLLRRRRWIVLSCLQMTVCWKLWRRVQRATSNYPILILILGMTPSGMTPLINF